MGQGKAAPTLTRYLGLIGHPVGHSVSPAMQNEAFRRQGMNCHYGAFSVEPDRLKEALDGVRALGFLGLNVTIPHKEAVIPYLDEVAPMALQIGAVNTIVNRGGRLMGYNTDGWGFIASLEEAGVRVTGRSAVVLGAGGAARAIAFYLAKAGVGRLTISNRNPERAERLAQDVRAAMPSVTIEAVEALSTEERTALIEAGIAINCTPQGMQPQWTDATPVREISLLRQDAVVYDTVYRPLTTRFLQEARLRGLKTVSGLGMLVHQGACAWEYWFGRRGPVTIMYQAAAAALEGEA
ncbi:MAG: shikimate dehydrogenase [Mycobacterium leprae]